MWDMTHFLLPTIALVLSRNVECFSFNDVSLIKSLRNLQDSSLTFQLSAASTDLEEAASSSPVVVEPIEDTFYSKNPIKRVYSFLVNLKSNDEKNEIHEASLTKTGGVWKTKFLGKPAYGVSAFIPEITRNLTKLESQGLLTTDWPESVLNTLGHSSLIANNPTSDSGRKVFLEALSTRSILNQSLSGIEETVDEMKDYWQECADTGKITTFAEDVSAVTYEVIATAVFGPGQLTDDDMKQLREWTDSIAKGLFSLPIDKPIIRNIPFFRRYPLAMKARSEMRALLIDRIAKRKAVIAKNGVDHESVGMLDAFLLSGDLEGDQLVDFCVDNIILSIFAGYDTTASVSTNLILLLHEYATKEELEQIRSELNAFDMQSISASSAPANGMLESVPSFKSAVYESFRFRPVVGSTFRKTTAPIQLGNVAFPANTTVQWSHLHGHNSPTFFETTERACPLRFLSTNEPAPFIFGYGKHKCPGQFLAQIELILVMKAFLCNFDFSLLPDQNTSPTVPFNKPKSGVQLKLTAR
ncbi:MAG: hypothetical protein SGBAC_008394 [Bacillariaceae sp.]